jgi:hypothetical protein
MTPTMESKRAPYWLRLGITFMIATMVFIVASFLIKFGFTGTVETGIPFPFHHSDSMPPVRNAAGMAMDSDRPHFLLIGVLLDLGSYLLGSVLILRFIDASRARK